MIYRDYPIAGRIFRVKIITRLSCYSRDFTGNCANTFPIFFLQNKVKPKREEIITRRNAEANHDGCRFIHSGNISSCCDRGIGRGGDHVIGEYIRRRVEKEREKKKERVNRAVRQPAGRLSSRRQIARCSTKSRGNLGDYTAHRSSRVRSPESRV